MQYMDELCPLCRRPVRTGRQNDFTFIDCRHCSHYRIDDEGNRSLFVDPLSPEEVANIASYQWEWPTCELNAVNVRNLGRFWCESDHHRFCQVLLRVLHNTFEQRPFILEFDNPMLLGCTGSTSPTDLRKLVMGFAGGHFLPVLEDYRTAIRTMVSDDAMTLMQIPISVAPGVAWAIDLATLRKRAA